MKKGERRCRAGKGKGIVKREKGKKKGEGKERGEERRERKSFKGNEGEGRRRGM
jgi:hypothetical protein